MNVHTKARALANVGKGMITTDGGKTYRYPGVMQYPMNVENQRRAGLIARKGENVSIHPGRAAKKKAAEKVRRQREMNMDTLPEAA